MKIGLVTMHWGRNYGALLQAYATFFYLQKKGYDVDIINYKPRMYDARMIDFILHPTRLMGLSETLTKQAIDRKIAVFRNRFLKQTKRFYSESELKDERFDYDVYISGSDQILNPSLTLHGEGGPTSVYYLGFADERKKRISYASSFGCMDYPDDAAKVASEWINNFQAMGVREDSGLRILDKLGFKGKAVVVPDPTILLGYSLFDNISLKKSKEFEKYFYVHILRSKKIDIPATGIEGVKVLFGDRIGAMRLDEWLNKLYNSKGVITNSYHASIMAVLMHKPFAVIVEEGESSGMNDRFFTLYNRLGLNDRIVKNNQKAICDIMRTPIDWNTVDSKAQAFREVGENYLNTFLTE